jgi:hypothetical protein
MTLCLPLHECLFLCVLRPIRDFIMKKKPICVKVCVQLGKTAPEAHEMLKTSVGDITIGRTSIFSGFLDTNMEKTAKDRERGGCSSIVSGDEKLRTVRKIVKEERRKHHFGNHRQVWPFVWNISGDSKGGLIHVDESLRTLCLASPTTSRKEPLHGSGPPPSLLARSGPL